MELVDPNIPTGPKIGGPQNIPSVKLGFLLVGMIAKNHNHAVSLTLEQLFAVLYPELQSVVAVIFGRYENMHFI